MTRHRPAIVSAAMGLAVFVLAPAGSFARDPPFAKSTPPMAGYNSVYYNTVETVDWLNYILKKSGCFTPEEAQDWLNMGDGAHSEDITELNNIDNAAYESAADNGRSDVGAVRDSLSKSLIDLDVRLLDTMNAIRSRICGGVLSGRVLGGIGVNAPALVGPNTRGEVQPPPK